MSNIEDKIISQILDRLDKLEARVFVNEDVSFSAQAKKIITLPEIARNTALQNGQQKIAAIVGHHEKNLKQGPISLDAIKSAWKDGKFSGSYNSSLLTRSIKDGFVRDHKNGSFDLTQTGENFFEKLMDGERK